jgi:hypothetical protein
MSKTAPVAAPFSQDAPPAASCIPFRIPSFISSTVYSLRCLTPRPTVGVTLSDTPPPPSTPFSFLCSTFSSLRHRATCSTAGATVSDTRTPTSHPPFPSSNSFSSLQCLFPRYDTPLPRQNPEPCLLVLIFSSVSFLNSTIYDAHTREPLYVIRTNNAASVIMRADPWERCARVADIIWPLSVPVTLTKEQGLRWVLLRMGGWGWKSGWDLLKVCQNRW